ncbi:MAG: hypothetical protein KDB07_06530, partial [Planctomycetes bacterium]|nr:hypothetical protein [Planctomycetota bacterium]
CPDPKIRAIVNAHPGLKVIHRQKGRSLENNFIRLLPLQVSKLYSNKPEFGPFNTDSAPVFLRNLQNQTLMKFQYEESAWIETLEGYGYEGQITSNFAERSFNVFDTPPLPAGEYEVFALGQNTVMQPLRITHDGKSMTPILYKPDAEHAANIGKHVVNFEIELSVGDRDGTIEGFFCLVVDNIVLYRPRPVSATMGKVRDSKGLQIRAGDNEDYQAKYLIAIYGYPLLELPIRDEVEFRKSIHWDGKTWQVEALKDE